MDITTGLDLARNFPEKPGVYKMYAGKQLLYVGKAKNLRVRVMSYFSKNLDSRLTRMVSQATHIDVVVVPSEIDALILESHLVKRENPKYNIMLRDDKGYPYLHVSTDKDFPSVSVAYRKSDNGEYFGPFPSRQSVYEAMDTLNRHFLMRTCNDSFFQSRRRPCLEFQMKRCSAPCVEKISLQSYRNSVNDLLSVLRGKGESVIPLLTEKMHRASEEHDYESALALRNRITSLRYVQSKITVEAGNEDYDLFALSYGGAFAVAALLFVRQGQIVGTSQMKLDVFDEDEHELIRDAISRFLLQGAPVSKRIVVPASYITDTVTKALTSVSSETVLSGPQNTTEEAHISIALQSSLSGLSALRALRTTRLQQLEDLVKMLDLHDIPQRVECFDISHLQGTETVASQVVFHESWPLKAAYRKYNIDNAHGDDLAAMKEALMRRFRDASTLPDLLLIDGGAAQVAVAMSVLGHYGLHIPCVGVSKGARRIEGEEKLVVGATGEEFEPGPRSPALQYIQAVRNEAHRFAITGHRKKMQKRMLVSSLEKIDGVGKEKRQILLNAFGGFSGLKEASLQQISDVKGIGSSLAKKVFEHLHSSDI